MVLGFLEEQLQRIACGIASSSDGNLYDREPSLYLPPGGGIGFFPAPYEPGTDAIARWACGAGPPPGTGGIPPNNSRSPGGRVGGWCDVSYNMTVVWKYKLYPSGAPTDNPPVGSAVISVLGPITSFFTDSYPSPNLNARNSAGTVYNVNSIFNDTLDFGEITSVTFSRVDGLPDICQPDPNRPIAPPITIPDPRGPLLPPITITPIVPIIIAPIGIFPRFVVDIGGVNLTANIDVRTGDITIGGPGEFPPGCCCSPPGRRSPPTLVDPDEPDPSVNYLIGVHTRCEIEENAKATEIMGDFDDKSIYAPRLGSVNFLIEAGGKRSWSRDYDIKMARQFFSVEGPYYATDYQVISIPGVEVVVTPVYGTILAPQN